MHAIDFVHWVVGDRITRVFGLMYPGRATGRPDESTTLVLECSPVGAKRPFAAGAGFPIGTNDL